MDNLRRCPQHYGIFRCERESGHTGEHRAGIEPPPPSAAWPQGPNSSYSVRWTSSTQIATDPFAGSPA